MSQSPNSEKLSDEHAQVISNFDRLHVHLNQDSLALALLDAWAERVDGSDGISEMLGALELFHNRKQEDNDQCETE